MKHKTALLGILLFLILSMPILSIAAKAEPVSSQANCEDIPSLIKEVSILRGLTLKTPVRCIEMERDEYIAYKKKSYIEDVPRDRLTAEEIAFKLIGLIDPLFSYHECLAESYTQALVASYDTRLKAILLPRGEGIDRSVLAHELVHALQDQHFRLGKLQGTANQASDSALALAALVEGDALLVQQKMPRQSQTTTEGSPINPSGRCSPQPGLEAQFDFPNSFGAIYVERLTSRSGVAALNRTFSQPARCTSEVIHSAVSSPCPRWQSFSVTKQERAWMVNQLGGTPQEVFSDSLGEYTLGLILSPQIGRAKAILAAKGWAGDKMILWQGPRGHGVSLVTEWRDSKDAREFAHLFSVSAAQRYAVSIEPTVKNWQLSKGKITLRLAQGEKRVVLFFTSY